ncbi:hypothetical protein OG417_41215 [Actinoallomurus sp. NBC_01490]|uniref:hypothetical protein n=1 Tax=Actinoallomurus sp. NBC_01490 TaxID=2903557 RepID=UPI002E32E82A|nr:hypothetical protein [Actinoallomurus sp. NBC_01490]
MDTVLVGGWRGYTPLMAIDLRTGARRRETDDRLDTVLPVPAGEGVLVGAPGETKVRLVDRCNGEELSRWRLPEPLTGSDDGPAFTPVGTDRFLVRCGRRSVVDIRLSSTDVRELVRAEADLVPTAVEYTAGIGRAVQTQPSPLRPAAAQRRLNLEMVVMLCITPIRLGLAANEPGLRRTRARSAVLV